MVFRKTSHKDYILLLSEHKDFVGLSDSCLSLLQMNLLESICWPFYIRKAERLRLLDKSDETIISISAKLVKVRAENMKLKQICKRLFKIVIKNYVFITLCTLLLRLLLDKII